MHSSLPRLWLLVTPSAVRTLSSRPRATRPIIQYQISAQPRYKWGVIFRWGFYWTLWWFWNILRVTCRPRPRHNHHYQHFICRRISSWFGPDCCPPPGPSVRWVLGGGDLFNYKVSQLHSYNTQHISHRITQRSAPALSPPPTQLMASLTTGAIITIVIIIAVVGIKLNWTLLIWTNWRPSHDLDI